MQLMKLRLREAISCQHPRDALSHMVAGITDSVDIPGLQHHRGSFICGSRCSCVLSVGRCITAVLTAQCNAIAVVNSNLQCMHLHNSATVQKQCNFKLTQLKTHVNIRHVGIRQLVANSNSQ